MLSEWGVHTVERQKNKQTCFNNFNFLKTRNRIGLPSEDSEVKLGMTAVECNTSCQPLKNR